MNEQFHHKWVGFPGRMLMVGFGSVGQGMLPLLLRHVDLHPERLTILSAEEDGREIAKRYGIEFVVEPLTPDNYRDLLHRRLGAGDFLLNLSINVGSVDLIAWSQANGVLYLDACIEPWAGGYYDTGVPPALRTNYALREAALALRRPAGPTAVLTHGVNPGLVSHFVKQALLDLAADLGANGDEPRSRAEWAQLARTLNIRAIHIAERDTQVSPAHKRPGEFVNTWSVHGFAGEGCQPAELGWGTHERNWPVGAERHSFGCAAAIYLDQPGAATRVRSWTPLEGPYHGFLITHGKSISIADYLTVREGERPIYRPTVHYAYHPCDDAVLSIHEMAGKNWQLQAHCRQFGTPDIDCGMDELGVLLLGHTCKACWYGSPSPSTRPARCARTTTPPACKRRWACWAAWCERSGIPSRASSIRRRWTSGKSCRSPPPTWARWWASTAIGPLWPGAASCFRKTWMWTTPGSSRTFWSGRHAHLCCAGFALFKGTMAVHSCAGCQNILVFGSIRHPTEPAL